MIEEPTPVNPKKEPSAVWKFLDKKLGVIAIVVIPILFFVVLFFKYTQTSEKSPERIEAEVTIDREHEANMAAMEKSYKDAGYVTMAAPVFVATKEEFALLVGMMDEDDIERYSDDDTIIYLEKGDRIKVISGDELMVTATITRPLHFGKTVYVPTSFIAK